MQTLSDSINKLSNLLIGEPYLYSIRQESSQDRKSTEENSWVEFSLTKRRNSTTSISFLFIISSANSDNCRLVSISKMRNRSVIFSKVTPVETGIS
ncbi:hypothetical protein CDAR_119331 [Caerostris darwini]|uniref:Uncharacterized protein n=1 Tax=Caerostris darwini TaxID=1538125 RepID=A0AAV4U4B1_9ARAC|nr:hypothetical protein CDAR_119331 [Caerostris darwini]